MEVQLDTTATIMRIQLNVEFATFTITPGLWYFHPKGSDYYALGVDWLNYRLTIDNR